ncbi:MAG: hypothetical protein P8178_07765 [Candidatus Thiodiazotropha sp.]
MVNTAGLSLDQAPPIAIPFLFFITAALFAVGLGTLLALLGESPFVSRWSPQTLALTHLITVGFLAQVMTGAMIQLLPVLAGSPLPAAVTVARLVHLVLLTGAILLSGGFLTLHHATLMAGAVLLAFAFTLFLGAVAIALLRPGAPRQIGYAIGIGWVALIPTVILGLLLVFGYTGRLAFADLPRLVDLHLSWGLLGWVGLVLFAVVFRLVPIFYVTREFPAWMKNRALPAVFALLVALSLGHWLDGVHLETSLPLIVTVFALFALSVFGVLHRRKRRIVDSSMLFIWTGLASLLIAAVVWAASDNPLLLGVLLLAGVCLTVPTGLVYKVIPFLCWFHLQGLQIQREKFTHTLPSMKHFISEKAARRHYLLHLAALLLLITACVLPADFGRPAGIALMLSSLLFLRNLLMALIEYRKVRKALLA